MNKKINQRNPLDNSAMIKQFFFQAAKKTAIAIFSVIVCVNILANGKYSGCYYW